MEPSPALAKLTSDERRQILDEYDSYPRGDARRGALLRRHGLYSSQVATWRERHNRGQTDLRSQTPSPKPQPVDPLTTKLARLTRENTRLQAELDKATLQGAAQARFGTTQSNNNLIYTRPSSIGTAYTRTSAKHSGTTDTLYVDGTPWLPVRGPR